MGKRYDAGGMDTRKGAEEGYELELKDPEGAKTGIFITLIGADCKEYQNAVAKTANRRMNDFARTKRFNQTAEQIDDEALERLVVATKGWRSVDEDDGKSEPIVLLHGETLSFTSQNVRKFYRAIPLIREQAEEAVHDRANFLPKPATSF